MRCPNRRKGYIILRRNIDEEAVWITFFQGKRTQIEGGSVSHCATFRGWRHCQLHHDPLSTELTMKRLLLAFALVGAAFLTGCGVVAAPCRVASAGLKMVPLVGHVAAAPTDACADIID